MILCIYLKADYLVAVERLNKRGNRKENENDDILIGTQNSFERRIKDYPNSVIWDATKTEDKIADEAYMKILELKNRINHIESPTASAGGNGTEFKMALAALAIWTKYEGT